MIYQSIILNSLFLISSIIAIDLHKKNELRDSLYQKTEIVMAKIDQHCHALNHTDSRVRRHAVDSVRYVLVRVLQDCDNDGNVGDVNPTVSAPTTTPVHSGEGTADPCRSSQTRNLTESWRKGNSGANLRPNNGLYACDSDLQGNNVWFRFTGAAGVQLANRCAPAYSCGGHGGFWSNAQMPSRTGEIKRVPIYGSWSSNCNWYTWPAANALTVKRCSARAGDFVYKVQGTTSCYWTFCGMDLQAS